MIVIFALGLIILILATARWAHAITLDKISVPMHDAVKEKLRLAADGHGRHLWLWKLVAGLIGCYWCNGFWIAGIHTIPAIVILAAQYDLSWWMTAGMIIYVWPAVAYAASWIIDHEG